MHDLETIVARNAETPNATQRDILRTLAKANITRAAEHLVLREQRHGYEKAFAAHDRADKRAIRQAARAHIIRRLNA